MGREGSRLGDASDASPASHSTAGQPRTNGHEVTALDAVFEAHDAGQQKDLRAEAEELL
jgi:hypothetical protein